MFVKTKKIIKYYFRSCAVITGIIALLSLAVPLLLMHVKADNPDALYKCWQIFEMILLLFCVLPGGIMLRPWYLPDSYEIFRFRFRSPLYIFFVFLAVTELSLSFYLIFSTIVFRPFLYQAVRLVPALVLSYEVLLLLTFISKRPVMSTFITVGVILWSYSPVVSFGTGLKITALVIEKNNVVKTVVTLSAAAVVLALMIIIFQAAENHGFPHIMKESASKPDPD